MFPPGFEHNNASDKAVAALKAHNKHFGINADPQNK